MSNMVVRTNVMALNSHRNLGMTGTQQRNASGRLSSGFRINSAADDAAGLAISEKMRGQIRGLNQASRNAQDGISLIQTAEGAMQTVNEMVIRIRELVIQAANDTNAHEDARPELSDRNQIQAEIDQLLEEIDAVTERTEFNTRTLLDGSLSDGGFVHLSVAERAAMGAFLAEAGTAGPLAARNGAIDTQIQGQRVVAGLEDELAFITELRADVSGRITANSINQALYEAQGAWSALLDLDQTQSTTMEAQGTFLLAHINSTFGTNLTTLPTGVQANVGQPATGGTNSPQSPPAVGDATVTALRDNAVARVLSSAELVGRDWYLNQTGDGDTNVTREITTFSALNDRYNDLRGFVEAGQTRLTNDNIAVVNSERVLNGLIGSNPTLNATGHTFAELYAAFNNTQPDGSVWFQIGANEGQGIRVSIESVTAARMGIDGFATGGLQSILTENGQDIGDSGWITMLDEALSHVTGQRALLGAVQNRLEFTIDNLNTASENLSASESRIRDADMALEMMRLTQSNILQQAATSMLAQANQAPQAVLQLLG